LQYQLRTNGDHLHDPDISHALKSEKFEDLKVLYNWTLASMTQVA